MIGDPTRSEVEAWTRSGHPADLARALADVERDLMMLQNADDRAREDVRKLEERVSAYRMEVIDDLLPYPRGINRSPAATAQLYAGAILDLRDAVRTWVRTAAERQRAWQRWREVMEQLAPGFDRHGAASAGYGLSADDVDRILAEESPR